MNCDRCGHEREDSNLTYEGRAWAVYDRIPFDRRPGTSGLLCPWCDIKLDKFLALELRDEDEKGMERHETT